MKFSICIPNYNYAAYVEATINSALTQDVDLEILFCDNASTDASFDVASRIALADPRLKVVRNRWNVGFAGNLDRACNGASGDRQLLLSSDDLIQPGTLALYQRLIDALGDRASSTILSSGWCEVDGDGKHRSDHGIDRRMWADSVADPELSAIAGAPVHVGKAVDLLRRGLTSLRLPLPFVTTCYTREMYEGVEGYSNGRLMNPDKPFAWKILSIAETVLFIDAPLFGYRVHPNNQNSLQSRSGALKHLVDQYVATFDTPPAVLARAGMTSADLAKAFVEEDIVLRGFKKVAEGDRVGARRGLAFGRAAYPALAWSGKHMLLHLLARMGPIGTWIAHKAYRRRIADAQRSMVSD